MVLSSLTQNTRMGFLLVALLIAFTIVFSTVSAVTPPPPTGFSTGGLFAQYFQNAATGSDTVTAVDILKDCPANTYMYGFITTGANFFTKKCRSATYIQAWNVNGNPGTTGANFL